MATPSFVTERIARAALQYGPTLSHAATQHDEPTNDSSAASPATRRQGSEGMRIFHCEQSRRWGNLVIARGTTKVPCLFGSDNIFMSGALPRFC
jgi:hypothetical protein